MATITQERNMNQTQVDTNVVVGVAGLQLTGEQIKILGLAPNGHILIKGCAGSGKTLVAVMRAKYLKRYYSDLFRDARVGVFAYNKPLIKTIRRMLGPSTDINAWTLDSWLYHYLKKNQLIDNQKLKRVVRTACDAIRTRYDVKSRSILNQDTDFYRAEISWIKGRLISTLDAYRDTKRTGRGTAVRVTAEDRQVLWEVFETYQRELRNQHIQDMDDRVLEALERTKRPDFNPPFTHIVIDEAKDLSMARITLLSRLVNPKTNSITLIADSAQQIYQSGFSWADTGLGVVGHSYELRHNYRNTRQIAMAADSLLAHEDDKRDFTTMKVVSREGPQPVVLVGKSDFCFQQILMRIKTLPANETCAVAAYSNQDVELLASKLNTNEINTCVIRNKDDDPAMHVICSTFHLLKGLEFDHVFLWNVSAGGFPPETNYSSQQRRCRELEREIGLPTTSDVDVEEISRFRKLLYVAMTRARQTLTVACIGRPSRFIDEIDKHTVEFRQES